MKRSSGQFIFAVSILAVIVLAGTTLSLAASKSATPKADRVEVRINELHTALNITPEQEDLWNNVAQVMRDNAKTMDTLITAQQNAKPMNAVEELQVLWRNYPGTSRWHPEIHPGLRCSLQQHV